MGALFNLPTFGFWLGIFVAAWPTAFALSKGLVYNRPWQGLVTQDILQGEMIPYGPGLHPRLFWEETTEGGNVPLTPIDTTFEIEVSTLTARIKLMVFFQWAPDITKMPKFLAVRNEAEINAAFPPFLQSFLSGKLAGETAEKVRDMIEDMNQALAAEFMGKLNPSTGESPTELEDQYGIRVVIVRVKDFTVPEEVQRTMDARDEAIRLNSIVAHFMGITEAELADKIRNKDIQPDDFGELLEKAMAVSGNATYTIQKVDIPGLMSRIGKNVN